MYKGKDKGRILNIKYSAGHWGMRERIKVIGNLQEG